MNPFSSQKEAYTHEDSSTVDRAVATLCERGGRVVLGGSLPAYARGLLRHSDYRIPYRHMKPILSLAMSDQADTFRRAARSWVIRSARKTFMSDWYGTSRSLASAFSSSSIDAGRRREIVVVEGLSWGKGTRAALPQSK